MMGIQHTFPNAAAGHAAGKLLTLHSPAQIAAAIDVLVDLLDTLDGNPDDEETGGEDAFALSPAALLNAGDAGCRISDPGGTVSSEDEPDYWSVVGGEQGPGCPISDPDTAIDDGPCDDPHQDLEHEPVAFPSYLMNQAKGPEPWQPSNDIRACRPHRDRIRQELCVLTSWGGFRLRTEPTMIVMPKRRRRRLSIL